MNVQISKLTIKPDKARKISKETVDALAESMAKIGLINAVTIDKDNNVIAGAHRILAAKKLGWKEIEAEVASGDETDRKLVHLDENLIRNNGTALERAISLRERKAIYEAKHPEAKKGGSKSKRNNSVHPKDAKAEAKPDPKAKAFTQAMAEQIGTSRSIVEKYVKVANKISNDAAAKLKGTALEDSITDLIALTKQPAEKQAKIVEAALKSESDIKGAVRKLKRKAQAAAVKKYRPPDGQFAVIVADPPWQFDKRADDETHRGRTDYPTMEGGDIAELKIPSADNCILLLWTTNAHLVDGTATFVAKSWGFEPKTLLTWEKNKMGTGDWLRGKTEHCILAVKGKPQVNLTNQTTLIKGDVREHSRKPESFYKLVEALCPGEPKLELFSRNSRKGWATHGAEAGALDEQPEKEEEKNPAPTEAELAAEIEAAKVRTAPEAEA